MIKNHSSFVAAVVGAAAMGVASVASAQTFGSNLIVNGNADAAVGSTNSSSPAAAPGWIIVTGMFGAVKYGVSGGWPDAGTPGPTDRGANFFCAGSSSVASGKQVIDLSAIAAAIDGGTVTATLSGWLGGYSNQDDQTAVSVEFKTGGGVSLVKHSIGPVTAADRAGVMSLLLRTRTDAVPTGARTAEVVVTMTRFAGSDNDGTADSLSLVLSGGACPADFNGDGAVDFFDYDDFVQCFEGGACPPGKTADFNNDTAVDFFDYDDFVAAFEAGC